MSDDTLAKLQRERDAARSELETVRKERDELRGIIDGTDHLSGNPAKWGLRSMLNGVTSQRDHALALLDRQLAGSTMSELVKALQKAINRCCSTTASCCGPPCDGCCAAMALIEAAKGSNERQI